jgi:hydroxymethylbilane synthase
VTERLILATRGSKLALAQADQVAGALQEAWPDLAVDIQVERTRGDDMMDAAIPDIGKGAFVNEVRAAVLAGRADVAVHSYKDLPTQTEPGLRIGAVPMRADPRDVLVSTSGKAFTYLPPGARIGTSSTRRSAQLLRRRSDVKVVPIRGNVDTRLTKVAAGEFDAVVLAAAGLARLGLTEHISEYFDTDLLIPAPAQGALALEIRADDDGTARRLGPLHDAPTAYAVNAERACLRRLGGGCQAPIGLHAVTDGQAMAIYGIVAWPDGTRVARMRWSGPCRPAEEVGSILADLLDAAGAQDILSGAPIPPSTRYATRRSEIIRDWEQRNPEDET